MVTFINHVIPRLDIYCALHLVRWRFLQHLPAKYRWRLKKSLTIWVRGSSTVPYGESSPGYCITFIKRLDKGLRKQLSGQNPLISPRLYISIGWQNRIDGARASWLLILLVITVVHVYCCTLRCYKKLKMKKQDFFASFLSLVTFWLRRMSPRAEPKLNMWYYW